METPTAQLPDPEQPGRSVHLDPALPGPRQLPAVGEAARLVEIEGHRVQVQQPVRRDERLGQPPVGGQGNEVVGRPSVRSREARRLGSAQRMEVAAASEPLPEVAGDGADVGSGSRLEVEVDVEPAIPG